MTSAVDTNQNQPLASAGEAMARQLTALRTDIAGRNKGLAHVVRLELPIEPLDPLAWIANQEAERRVYWSSRDGVLDLSAVGTADTVSCDSPEGLPGLFREIEESIERSNARIRYLGGLRFYANHRGDAAWDEFGAYWFHLPRFEIVRTRDQCFFCCNVSAGDSPADIGRLAEEVGGLKFDLQAPADSLPEPAERRDDPDEPGWQENIKNSLAYFRQGKLDKIVLARKTFLKFERKLDPFLLLRRLRRATPDCFHFCFQQREGLAFIGASPERLFKRWGRRIETESVAGTRPRGAAEAEDERLGAELLASGKDLREHYFVRDTIRDTIQPLCRDITVDKKVSLLKLARGQHLFTRFRGLLSHGVSDLDLVRSLHPTPAVGGCPTDEAVKTIREMESFDRGWYAAPVGWVGCDESEFAVAIRTGLMQGDCLSLFSGAGIVDGSTPDGEWAEIENKIGDFIKVLTSQ